MKIAIDIQTTLGKRSGFGFYVKNLVENLKKIDPNDQYSLIMPHGEHDFSMPQRFIWDQFRFPKIARKAQVDILHQPCFSVPILYRGKKIVTVHDIIPLKFPGNLPLASRLFYSKWMTYSYKFSDAIIADSECTKADIVKYLKISPQKIRVIHLAVAENFKPASSKSKVEQIKNKYHTGEKYFLHVGTIEPRKNLPFLVEAYFDAVKSGIKENLVIVGKRGWYYDKLFRSIHNLHLEQKVIFAGYVDDEDIPFLYCGATAFVFPSIYEGFGLPPLEAMACGTPVICSNTSSLPEVIGDAGILISPNNKPAWSKQMFEISRNKKLAQNLKIMGLKQAKKFSWEKTARETIEVYKDVLKDESY